MTDDILALNVGSSSLRFALFDAADLALRLRGHVDFGHAHSRTSLSGPLAGELSGFVATGQDAGEVVEHLVDSLQAGLPQLSLRCASHRIVHGGGLDPRPHRFNAALIDRLQRWAPMALLPRYQNGSSRLGRPPSSRSLTVHQARWSASSRAARRSCSPVAWSRANRACAL